MAQNSDNGKNVSRHILPTSSNLLGLCFLLLNFLKLWKFDKNVSFLIDKFIVVAIILFLVASVLSYASMRSIGKAAFYEKVADIFFLGALFVITAISVMPLRFCKRKETRNCASRRNNRILGYS